MSISLLVWKRETFEGELHKRVSNGPYCKDTIWKSTCIYVLKIITKTFFGVLEQHPKHTFDPQVISKTSDIQAFDVKFHINFDASTTGRSQAAVHIVFAALNNLCAKGASCTLQGYNASMKSLINWAMFKAAIFVFSSNLEGHAKGQQKK